MYNSDKNLKFKYINIILEMYENWVLTFLNSKFNFF